MKKILMLFAVAVMFVSNSDAQSLKGLFKKVTEKVDQGVDASSDFVDGLKSSFTNKTSSSSTLEQKNLVGTWTYQGVACKLETDDMLLALTSDAVAPTLEQAADAQLLKLGAKPGVSSVTFNSDGTCVITVNNYDVPATYSVKEGNKVTMSFLLGQVNATVDVEYNGSSLKALTQADKLLDIIKKLTAKGGSINSEATNAIKMLSTLVEGYDGLKLGLKLSK